MKLTSKQIDRFWSRVDKQGPDDCWEWQGYTNRYSELHISNTKISGHRLSAMIAGLDITGRVVCHRCDNTKCVNPNHLFVGAQADNMKDMSHKGRTSRAQNKLTDAEIHAIRTRYFTTKTPQTTLATQYNVSQKTISRIVNKLSYKNPL